VRCAGIDDVRARLAAVKAAQGEGIVLRRPGHVYASGRTGDWVRLKQWPVST
jgi:ATP-dependent DNA ligase